MSIKLKWTLFEPNDGVDIYRSEDPFDYENMPAPIGSVGANVTEFTDTTLERNKAYYYIFANKKGSEIALSAPKALGFFPETGPGNNTVIRGDYKLGLMDEIPAGNLFTSSTLVGMFSGHIRHPRLNDNSLVWHKLIIDNKILFFPSESLTVERQNSWLNMYNAGVVYGTDDDGLIPAPTPVNQFRTVLFGENELIVRLPKASTNEDGTLAISVPSDDPTIMDSELSKILKSTYLGDIPNSPYLKLLDNARAVGAGMMTQERISLSTTADSVYMAANGNTVSRAYNITFIDHRNVGSEWLPVLELIYP